MSVRRSLRAPARVLVVFLAGAAVVAAQSFQPLQLRVLNGTNQQRTAEPVTCGFPVAESENLYDVSLFRVLDPSGNPIPSQFRVLTRWSGERTDASKKLRWVQAAFLADVGPNASADYSVAWGVAAPAGGLVIIPSTNSIEIRNGVGGIFVIKSTSFFTPFKVVEFNGQLLLNSSLGNGGVEMTSSAGLPVTPLPTSTIVEQSGSVMCVIRQKGNLGALRYTCRWTFFAGRSDVTMEFRLENPQAYGLLSTAIPDGQVYFDKIWLKQPFGGSGEVVTSTVAARTPTTSSPWELTQDFAFGPNPTDVLAGFSYAEKLGASTVATGGRYAGAVDYKTDWGGVTVGVDRFWQNYPQAMKCTTSEIRLGLWPEWGCGPQYTGQYGALDGVIVDLLTLNNYRFEGGRWKTFRTVWDFRTTGSRTPNQVADFAERVNAPLAASPDPARIRVSKATGHLFVEAKTWPSLEMNRLEQFAEMMGDDAAADPVPNFGQIGFRAFRNRGGTYGGIPTYGWFTFGDLPWGDGYSSGHYDWAGMLWTQFARRREYKLFDVARDVGAYRRDYGQNHSTNTAETWRGAQFYEKGWWHGNSTIGQASHNWALGLGLQYALTGDEGSREALVENMSFLLRDPPSAWNGYWGDRILGWAVDGLVDGWAFVGTTNYLTQAGLGATQYQVLEQADGGLGYQLNPGTTPPSTKPWMAAIAARGIARYALNSGATTHHALLGRMRNFLVNQTLVPSTGPVAARTLPYTYDQWFPITGPINPSVHLAWSHVDALTHISAVNGSATDYALSKDLFDALVRYWQQGTTTATFNFNSTGSFSAITLRPLQYPGAETKALGNVMLWGMPHLALRAQNEGY
ncbi:MAG TPA: hypothetical protein VEI02_17270 [Planctomycetota bacterium]|nr:hypothetical protein [Planctomycetota bacterium]